MFHKYVSCESVFRNYCKSSVSAAEHFWIYFLTSEYWIRQGIRTCLAEIWPGCFLPVLAPCCLQTIQRLFVILALSLVGVFSTLAIGWRESKAESLGEKQFEGEAHWCSMCWLSTFLLRYWRMESHFSVYMQAFLLSAVVSLQHSN